MPPALLREVLSGAPPLPDDVRLGPALGEDAAVIDIEAGCLVVAADPITLTGEGIGWSAVAVNANDVAVMGVRPRWFLATVLLPVSTTDAAVRRLFAELQAACAELGVALVGGHSEITGAVRQSIVSGVMLGAGAPDRIVRSSGATSGDVVVQIGAAPIEGAAVLAAAGTSPVLWPPIGVAVPSISVVEPALATAALGRVRCTTPPRRIGRRTPRDRRGERSRDRRRSVRLPGTPRRWPVIEAAGANPWSTLASGTVLATFETGDVDDAVSELRRLGHVVAVIGHTEDGVGVADGAGAPIPWPRAGQGSPTPPVVRTGCLA